MACHTDIRKFVLYTQIRVGKGVPLSENYKMFKYLRDKLEQADHFFKDMKDIAPYVLK